MVRKLRKEHSDMKFGGNNGYMPTRGTRYSAGYDLYATQSITLIPQQSYIMPSEVSIQLEDDKVFLVFPRSSLGAKGLNLMNTVGVIDSDFYPNAMGLMLKNTNPKFIMKKFKYFPFQIPWINNKQDIIIKKGDRIAQGIIIKYYTVKGDETTNIRTGGVGHTGI